MQILNIVRENTCVTGACISARANVVFDSRSIRARKPLFYANLTALVASNKLFARSSPFYGQYSTERYSCTREERAVPFTLYRYYLSLAAP